MERQVFNGSEARQYLGLGWNTFIRLVRNGTIPCWQDAETKRRRYPKASLDLFLASFADQKKAS